MSRLYNSSEKCKLSYYKSSYLQCLILLNFYSSVEVLLLVDQQLRTELVDVLLNQLERLICADML